MDEHQPHASDAAEPPARESVPGESDAAQSARIPQAPVVRTGSTDRHLVSDDEPVHPEPARRPRTYRDLDEIPEDFD
jgi:hypothetical protein